MKEIILVIIGAIVLVTGLEPYINSNSQYLAEKAKSEQAIQALESQKAARKADLEYMDQVVEIANACAAIPFDFCPDTWTDQTMVNSYTQQGLLGLPGWRYYSILSFAFILKILSLARSNSKCNTSYERIVVWQNNINISAWGREV